MCVCVCVCVCVAKPVAVELCCHATALICLLVIRKKKRRFSLFVHAFRSGLGWGRGQRDNEQHVCKDQTA